MYPVNDPMTLAETAPILYQLYPRLRSQKKLSMLFKGQWDTMAKDPLEMASPELSIHAVLSKTGP